MDDENTVVQKPFSVSKMRKIQYFITLFVFIATLLLTLYTQKQNLEKERNQFNLICEQISLLVNDRMDYYTQLLLGGVGLFASTDNVTRENWKKFSDTQHLDSKFLGIQGIGYSLVIQPDELKDHIQKIRQEGFLDYTLKPQGVRDLYTSVIYLEPFDKRNQRAFGYDMFSQETRHLAMAKAIETGNPSVSGKVRLLQENGTDEQAGFLLYIPVYKEKMPLNTIEQRYEAIKGFVYAPFRTKNLFVNIAGNMTDTIGVEIYDGNNTDEDSLLLRTFQRAKLKENILHFEDTINIGDRVWKLKFSSLSSSKSDITNITPWIILVTGVLLSSILFLFFNNLIKTERKQQKYIDELQLVSLKKSLALKAGIIGIWEWDFRTNTLQWDQHMYDIYGISQENDHSPYSMWANSVDANDKELAEKVLSEAVETNTEYNHKFWIITPNNERKYIHAIGINELDSNNKALRMVGTNIDVTEQKLLEVKLSNEQEALLQVKTTGFVHIKGTDFMWTNIAFEEMFGYNSGELQGQNIKQICANEKSCLENEQKILKALRLNGTFSGEISAVKKDTTPITILVAITKLKDTSNEAMGVIMDITRQKQLEQNLQDEVEKKTQENFTQFQILQQQSKLAAMGEMIGAIAHQWRQPLNELSIRIQKLKYNYQKEQINEEFLLEFVEKNKKTISFMSNTIDDFRNFFRIDKEKKVFDVKVAIQEIINIQSAQLNHHNVLLELQGNSFEYKGYKTELQQVIINLINNAKDALVSNKVVEAKIIIMIQENKISIQDNAGGIAEDIIQRVFEPYFTTKDQGEGTGMGLYMSKMITEDNMKGKLTIQNKNDGVEACIYLY